MKLNLEEIKAWPLTTNKIEVEYDRDKMFSQYSIVSYYSLDKEYKNLAYEQLADIPFISVCGIRAKWHDVQYPCVRFFVMMKKEELQDVLKSLRDHEQIRARIDDLTNYDYKLQQRIIASLAINSLGKTKPDRMMYNNGVLLLCDDKNFLIPQSRKELVCLKVEVNEAYDSKTAKDWKAFLSKNADRVDIFKKVDRYITEGFVDGGKHKKTGWAHEVRKFGQDKMISSFISKQLKPDERECISKDDMKSMVETFKECMKENNKGKLDDNKLNSIIQKHLGSSEDNVVFFKKALTTAFFRQTSKLGLEFFRSKKIPVVFQWSDFNGKSLDNAEGKKEINDKWWLNGYKKSSAGKYGSITYSEMRHVERMNQTKNKIDVVKVGGHNINNDIFA